MKPTDTSEKELERMIVRYLAGISEFPPGATLAEPATAVYAPGGYVLGRASDYNRDVALELRRDAFASDGVILNNQWIADVDRLVGLMGQQRSDLSIVYRCNAYAPIADDRVAAVKALVIAKWKAAGHDSDPVIKTKVECGP